MKNVVKFPKSGRSLGEVIAEIASDPVQQAHKQELDQKKQEHRESVLRKYGSQEAIWRDTQIEAALRQACHELVETKANRAGSYTTLRGWNGYTVENMPDEVRAAVEQAHPMPTTVRGAYGEWIEWECRADDLDAFGAGHEVWSRARVAIIEDALDTIPAQNKADLLTRVRWLERLAVEARLEHDQMRQVISMLALDVIAVVDGGR